ncbi:MAG TPA: shikimate dehydrogenase [Alphaproteobacteria bacterium]|nr:shikimate dehydrogenase [Alphaproteobacteria bacterium]
MSLTGRARLAGVIGWPIEHSRSPRLHGYWLERYRIDGAYVPLAVPPAHVAQALRMLALIGFRGVNVTVPHKEAALAAVDVIDPTARRIGAVNTVAMESDGTLTGFNTDGDGFLTYLRAKAPAWRADARPAVVVGAGGAARAVVAALLDAGVPELRLVNRTRERAEEIAVSLADKTIRVEPWVARNAALDGAGLLVNTTTLGMTGQPALPVSLEALPADACVFDCVYAPLETPLLKVARARGLTGVDGLGMLIHQARPGFARWFGVEPEIDERLYRLLAEGP